MQSIKIPGTTLVFAFLFAFTPLLTAQNLSLDEVLQTLDQMQVFQENKKLRRRVLSQLEPLDRQSTMTRAEYDELEAAYIQLQYLYNQVYLGGIKADLSNYREVKRMVSRIPVYAGKYTDAYERVVEHYNDRFLPVVQGLDQGPQQGDLQLVVAIGGYLFDKIVTVISKRKADQTELLQQVVSTANRLLFKNLLLPDWEELNIPRPNSQVGNPGNNTSTTKSATAPQLPPVTMPINTEALTAKIRFEEWTANGLQPMNFRVADQRAVTAPDFQAMGDMILGTPGSNPPRPVQVDAFRLRSEQRYPSGTYYRLNAQTNGLVYVFSVNSGNKMYGFYPLVGEQQDMTRGHSFELPANADMILGTPTRTGPTTGMSEIQIPDREHYIQIVDAPGSSIPEAETLVVIFSRAELDMREIVAQMERLGPNRSVQERLAQIFGNQAATPAQANLTIQNNTVHIDLPGADVHVLPLTFAILRQ